MKRKVLDLTLIILGITIIAWAIFVSAPTIEKTAQEIMNKIEPARETRIAFVGDIMMDRHIRRQARNWGYDHFFECAEPELKKNNFVVGNLEGTVTSYASVSEGKPQEDMNHFRFTMDPASLLALKNSGINIVGLANNHTYDFGKEGIEMTGKNILKAGLKYFGNDIDKNFRTIAIEDNKNKIFIVPYNQFFGSREETLSDIQKLKSDFAFDGVIIVFAHWGDEYVPANANQKKLAHEFIDAGADAIIGMHPHVLQETENYKGKFIAYSIGNFVFDQYFDESVKKGGVIEMVVSDNKIKSASLRETYLDDERRVCLK